MNIGDNVTEVMELVEIEFVTRFGFPNRIYKFVGETGTVFHVNTTLKAASAIEVGEKRIITAKVKGVDLVDNALIVFLSKPWIEELEAA